VNQSNFQPPELQSCRGRILVVDDEERNRQLLGEVLELQGHEVAFAEDGQQALEKAMANPPDVILLDIKMPTMDGYEVCRHLRLDPILAEVSIILVTSLDDRAARLCGLDAGADDFITKPVDLIELQTRVRNVVQLNRYRKLLQERKKAQRAQAEILSSCETTLVAWVRILERDDRVAPGRCERVTQWALCLAKSAGMAEEGALRAMRWSVLLHTIGAMAVPAAFRGRADLAPSEETQVHQQETWLCEALAPVGALHEAFGILAQRHEHWDGSGCPGGLKGEAILPAARVLAVALAWETTHAPSATVARLALLKTQTGRRFDPRLVEALELTVSGQESARSLTAAPLKTAAIPTAEFRPPHPLWQRLSLASTGARAQFAVALALLSVIPLLIVISVCLTGWLGIKASLNQLGPAVLLVLPFMALGAWLLAKYPINVIRLRHYMERLTQGVFPDQVTLLTNENDLAAIELLLRKVVQQTETRVRTIEAQSEALLEAERQRVMIQSLSTACHQLGQPATVISAYLELMRRMALPTEAQAMLAECQGAADKTADILKRLQGLTVYRTEPYLSPSGITTESPESSRILTV